MQDNSHHLKCLSNHQLNVTEMIKNPSKNNPREFILRPRGPQATFQDHLTEEIQVQISKHGKWI